MFNEIVDYAAVNYDLLLILNNELGKLKILVAFECLLIMVTLIVAIGCLLRGFRR